MRKNKLEFLLTLLILAAAFFVRIYRLNDLLGFYYDEGRDALVVWDLIYKGKYFLIGPTTGLEGIFRGPWYYWLITPFYYLGKGNPVYPSLFLALLTTSGIGFLYYLAKEIGGKTAGFLAIFLASFSYSLVISSRGLSNLIPMYLISMLYVFSIHMFFKRKIWAMPLASLIMGLAMQFGSAAEVFYIPSFLVILYLNRKLLPSKKILLAGVLLFIIPFLPQIIFDLRHHGVLSNAILKFLTKGGSQMSFWEIFKMRLGLYGNFFSSKLWSEDKILTFPFVVMLLMALKIKSRKLLTHPLFKSVLLIFLVPFLGLLFFRGNKGVIYDYYLTGYYLVYLLLISVIFASVIKYKFGKIVLAIFLLLFIGINTKSLIKLFSTNLDTKGVITYGNQKRIIDWIYKDAGGGQFNIDVYVPPVIPYAYDYLFMWKGNGVGIYPDKNTVDLLYTIFEEDNYLLTRLDTWLDRQDKIGKVIKDETFGGITVQRRIRYEKPIEK